MFCAIYLIFIKFVRTFQLMFSSLLYLKIFQLIKIKGITIWTLCLVHINSLDMSTRSLYVLHCRKPDIYLHSFQRKSLVCVTIHHVLGVIWCFPKFPCLVCLILLKSLLLHHVPQNEPKMFYNIQLKYHKIK